MPWIITIGFSTPFQKANESRILSTVSKVKYLYDIDAIVVIINLFQLRLIFVFIYILLINIVVY